MFKKKETKKRKKRVANTRYYRCPGHSIRAWCKQQMEPANGKQLRYPPLYPLLGAMLLLRGQTFMIEMDSCPNGTGMELAAVAV